MSELLFEIFSRSHYFCIMVSWALPFGSVVRLPTLAFKTDTDISAKPGARRDRELQAWQPEAAPPPPTSTTTTTTTTAPPSGPPVSASNASNASGPHIDELTFGPGASTGGGGREWDQFAANEALFGVRVGFVEEAYTTKLDRNAPDFRERERKAMVLANEIMRVSEDSGFIGWRLGASFRWLIPLLLVLCVGSVSFDSPRRTTYMWLKSARRTL